MAKYTKPNRVMQPSPGFKAKDNFTITSKDEATLVINSALKIVEAPFGIKTESLDLNDQTISADSNGLILNGSNILDSTSVVLIEIQKKLQEIENKIPTYFQKKFKMRTRSIYFYGYVKGTCSQKTISATLISEIETHDEEVINLTFEASDLLPDGIVVNTGSTAIAQGILIKDDAHGSHRKFLGQKREAVKINIIKTNKLDFEIDFGRTKIKKLEIDFVINL